MKSYEVTIGLEIHCELKTDTKLFCSCKNAFGAEPNTYCCPVCVGMPGAMPRINEKAIEYAVKAGLALGCEINRVSRWDRKNYFYPDLPKAWQTSQFDLPLCVGGKVDFLFEGKEKSVRLNRIHLEEDAGKLIHEGEKTLIDYNRCGVPLIEIVTEPDIHSPEEAVAFLDELRSILKQSGVSECKMQEGNLRVDVNLSVAIAGEKMGTRTETKNLNSFKSVLRACKYEQKRQADLLERGIAIQRETRRWDDAAGEGECLRQKEDATDYRFFPEPDILPIALSQDYIDGLQKSVPISRKMRIEGYVSKYLLAYDDAFRIADQPCLYELFEQTVDMGAEPKRTAKVILGEVTRQAKVQGKEELVVAITPERLSECLRLVEEGEISLTAFSSVLLPAAWECTDDIDLLVDKLNIRLVSDDIETKRIVSEVISQNGAALSDYKSGNKKAFAFFVGQAMKKAQGKISPQKINEELKAALSKLV